MISQKKILVVEDNEINRMILKGNPVIQIYKVLKPEMMEALLYPEEYGEDGFSLILLDIIMPACYGRVYISFSSKADSSFHPFR